MVGRLFQRRCFQKRSQSRKESELLWTASRHSRRRFREVGPQQTWRHHSVHSNQDSDRDSAGGFRLRGGRYPQGLSAQRKAVQAHSRRASKADCESRTAWAESGYRSYRGYWRNPARPEWHCEGSPLYLDGFGVATGISEFNPVCEWTGWDQWGRSIM